MCYQVTLRGCVKREDELRGCVEQVYYAGVLKRCVERVYEEERVSLSLSRIVACGE